MSLTDDMQILSKVPLFAGLTDDQLRLIAFGVERRRIASGQMLFREHSPAECAYVIARGAFELSVINREGAPQIELAVGEGTMLSELALYTLCERKYTAIATEESEVIRITRIIFHRLIEEYPHVAKSVTDRIKDNIAAIANDAASMQHRFL